MPKGGPRPGSGRPKGAKSKRTYMREAIIGKKVDREITKSLRSNPRFEAARDVMLRLRVFAEGVAAVYMPPTAEAIAAMKAAGRKDIPKGDIAIAGQWADRAARLAVEMRKYEDAPMRSMDAPAPPPDPSMIERNNRITFRLKVFEGGKGLTEEDEDAA